MSEQLTFNLNLDASPMISAATQATQQLEQKFKQAGNDIRQDLERPIAIQAEFNLDGDPKKKYDEIVNSQKKIRQEQSQINKHVGAQKKLQDKVTQSLKGTVAEKKAALKLVERLMRTTGKTKEEMRVLAQYAKDLKRSLPKDSDMPSGGGMNNIEGSLTRAGIAANLATKAIELMGRALGATIQTGIEMQSLNLQMEAFAGGADQASLAMVRFKDIAAKTPLDVMQVAEAGKIMMAFGVDTDLAVEATERLAVVAAATGGDVNLLARNLGQVQAQSRAYTRDLTQFAIQGIPIWEELSNVTGKSVSELKELAKDGEIGMDEVMQSLRNMTQEGSAFAQVAERMQQTYAGKLALIQSEFQTTAGGIIDSISDIDTALGGISDLWIQNMMGSMQDFATVMSNTSTVLEQLRYFIDMELGQSGIQLGDIFDTLGQKLRENLLSIIPGIGPALNNVGTVINHFGQNSAGEFAAVKQMADDLGISVVDLTSKIQTLAQQPGNENIVEDFRNATEQAGNLRQELDANIAKIMEMSGVNQQYIQERIQGLEAERDAAQENLTTIGTYYDNLKTAAQQSYAEIKAAGDRSIANSEAIIAKLQEQIKATQDLGPAGKKLEEIRRRELEYTAKTGKELKGHVTDEEMKKLRAQATLEQLDGQKEAEKLRKQIIEEQKKVEIDKQRIKAEEQKLNEELKTIEEDRVKAVQDQNTEIGVLNGSINDLIGVLNGDLAPNWEAIEDLIADSATETGNVNTEQNILNGSINTAISRYNTILGQLDSMADKIRNMPKVSTGAPNAFSGGPVSGGDMRTVNELGKEAFLSASGKLSMINAPAWGEWRAPSSGTIIPAHLTKQLDIPTGGININKTAGAGAGVGAAVKVIQASGGDVFHQNVTVQASNPVQAANSMMVEMTRLRRRRFG